MILVTSAEGVSQLKARGLLASQALGVSSKHPRNLPLGRASVR